MRKNRMLQIRISEELLNICKAKNINISRYVRNMLRNELIKLDKKPLQLNPEIRVKTPYTFYAKLVRVIDGDTVRLLADLGFYIKAEVRVRFNKVNAPDISTPEGKEASAFVESELSNSNLVVETRKKDRYERYVAYIYYHTEYDKFVDIVRYGKIINTELIKKGLAKEMTRSKY